MRPRPEGLPAHIDAIVGKKAESRPEQTKEFVNRVAGLQKEDRVDAVVETRERDKQLFALAAQHVARYAESLGGPRRDYPEEMLMKLSAGQDGERNARYLTYSGHVTIEETNNGVEFIADITHELFHYASPLNLRADKALDVTTSHRQGLTAFSQDGEVRYFQRLHEAIVEESTRRVFKDMAKDPLLEKQTKATEEVKRWLRAKMRMELLNEEYIDSVVDDIFHIKNAQELLDCFQGLASLKKKFELFTHKLDTARKKGNVLESERYLERSDLRAIIDELFKKAPGEFKDKEEVYQMFAKANFTGQLLPLARKVERILGKGAFRKMGEKMGTRRDKPAEETDEGQLAA